jgi:peptidoglycan/LPS O-acetylase OafA/YrhL
MDSKLTRWMGIGMILFGFVLGLTTGLSSASGISTTLLTSLFTFVGGVLLTYSGFRRKKKEKEEETPRFDLAIIGKAVTCMVAGILLGLLLGISARVVWEVYRDRILMDVYGGTYITYRVPAEADDEEKTSVVIPASQNVINLLQSQDTTCQSIRSNLEERAYKCEEGSKIDAIRDLEDLAGMCCR